MPGERHHLLCHVRIPHPRLRSRQILNRNTQIRNGVLETILSSTQRGPGGRDVANGSVDLLFVEGEVRRFYPCTVEGSTGRIVDRVDSTYLGSETEDVQVRRVGRQLGREGMQVFM